MNLGKTVPVALKSEIQLGNATLITTLENGKTEEYEIEIEKIYENNNIDNKSMVIKITDERLIEKSGGIVQGMSGSPIIQNGKLIGALTHVMVNDLKLRICCFCGNYDQANEGVRIYLAIKFCYVPQKTDIFIFFLFFAGLCQSPRVITILGASLRRTAKK